MDKESEHVAVPTYTLKRPTFLVCQQVLVLSLPPKLERGFMACSQSISIRLLPLANKLMPLDQFNPEFVKLSPNSSLPKVWVGKFNGNREI